MALLRTKSDSLVAFDAETGGYRASAGSREKARYTEIWLNWLYVYMPKKRMLNA